MKSLAQILEENGHQADTTLLVPGLYIDPAPFGVVRRCVDLDGRTPVSVHGSQDGEWLATLRLEDLLAMIPDGYGQRDEGVST